jgi:serine/threonine-protein kinase
MSEDFPALGGLGPGSVVAGYRIEWRLGSGGMAVVYRAWDERLGRPVALKVMAEHWAGDETFRQRFIAESRAAATVDHPHVIPVHEAGEAGGVLFIAMRLVSGSDLQKVARRDGVLARVSERLCRGVIEISVSAGHMG